MPELVFKGKEYVYNHHLTVPYRPLVPDKKKSIGPADLGGNLIIHGDNLHALKSLLPRYAGKVDLVFIDPPYNTGNENWSYNDNVNSPIMREWLTSNPVNAEDMLRHDKWLCMMWPRLTLLRELLSERGSLWMTLDDNEVHRARAIIDEIFGEQAFIANVVWQKNYSPKNTAQFFSEDHDHLLVIAKNRDIWRPGLLERTEAMEARYSNPDKDSRGDWKPSDLSARNYYSEGTYEIDCPGGRHLDGPPPGTYWRVKKSKFVKLDEDKRIWWGESGNNVPAIKRFLSEVKQGRVPQTLWFYDDVGHTQDAKRTLLEIGVLKSQEDATMTPKPVALIERIIDLATESDSVILDSFAGSGTTGHAVLSANAKDQGTRQFVLVESEGYADRITAERIRRVIKGYAWSGTQREELLREKLTWTQLQKADALLARVEAIKKKENFSDKPDLAAKGKESRRFDKITATVKDGELMVDGEKKISQRVEGLGGEFTYCTLGEPLDPEGILSGKSLPDYENLGTWLYYAATGGTLERANIRAKDYYLGEALDKHVWLIYRPDLTFLKSADAALTLSFARTLREKMPGKPHLVFAAAKFLSNRQLLEHGVEFAALPHSLYRGA
jgi:adenine-specific DNA-methyltransferase